ncbi:MAG: type III PLP-dependent enzyme [Synergistaceae bacterium]|jgi:ornithine decarboxylase|nr:type III PLP-dependent enzyme [Synergistaceae bacterium]
MFDYSFDLDNYMTKERFAKFREFASTKRTPFLVTSLNVVGRKYDELKKSMPYAHVYYAIKANPTEEVLRLLLDRGSCFDIASTYELDRMLKLGATPDRMSYGNTIKKACDIKYAYEKGIRLYASDAESDVRKLAENAPGSDVFFRILTDGLGADWPLSRKFGAQPDVVFDNILLAKKLGLNPRGISFHVGSQQHDVTQWRVALKTCKELFDAARQRGVRLDLVNMGGGFPAHYLHPVEETYVYAAEITDYVREFFGGEFPQVIVEPGRYMVGDAGVLVSEVVMISNKERESGIPWLYLDAGKFGGLIETLDESIRYPIYSERTGEANDYVLAGPTCDSMDVLYEKIPCRLPSNLEEGDRLYIFTTGAYTQTYSAVYFNGFPPLESYVID